MGSNHIGVSKGIPRVHVRKKSQAFELIPGQTLQISILKKLNYLRGSIGLCENHRRLAIVQSIKPYDVGEVFRKSAWLGRGGLSH